MQNKDANEAHRAEASKQMSSIGRKLFRYVEFDENEELIYEVHKHPVGVAMAAITGLLISGIFIISAALLVYNFDSLGFDSNNSSALKSGIVLAGVILALITLVFTAIAVWLYRSNVVYITNEKIAEVSYPGIFNRKVTQLGNGNVEDVTAEQRGILSRIFNFGTMIVETAGEKENLNFTMVPDPHYCSQFIVKAHEDYIEKQRPTK